VLEIGVGAKLYFEQNETKQMNNLKPLTDKKPKNAESKANVTLRLE